jgi:RND family efflux transporter MFP subunit
MATMIRICTPALLLLLTACSSGDTGEAGSSPVALVSLATAQQGNISEMATLYGAVERGADAQYTLSAPAEGVVVSVAAPVGTTVRTGQLVVRLRPSPATRADLAKADSDAQAAQTAQARAERLRADGLASDADVETARAAAQAADALRTSLSSQTGALELRAPGSGNVATVVVNPGQLVAAGTIIATISRDSDLRARFGIGPSVAHRLSPGMTLSILPAEGGTPLATTVLSVDPTVDPQTRMGSVFVRIPAALGIGAGEPLTAQVPVTQSANALTIPYRALLDDGGQPYVFVVSQGIAHRRDVITGPSGGDRIAIVRGLAAGDKVVVEGGTAVEDGMKVRTR